MRDSPRANLGFAANRFHSNNHCVLTYEARCLGVDDAWSFEISIWRTPVWPIPQRTNHRVLDTTHASGSGEEVSQWLTNCAEAERRKRHTPQAAG